MATLGIDLSEVGLQAAVCADTEPQLRGFDRPSGAPEWPALPTMTGQIYFWPTGRRLLVRAPAKRDAYLWSKLAHDPAVLNIAGKPPSSSQLAFYSSANFCSRRSRLPATSTRSFWRPPGVSKDATTEEEKIAAALAWRVN